MKWESLRIVQINWNLYKRKYIGKIGYRLPLIDNEDNITIIVIKKIRDYNLGYCTWEIVVYPHNKPSKGIYYFHTKSAALKVVEESLNGNKMCLDNDDFSKMRVVKPVGSRGKQTVRTVRC